MKMPGMFDGFLSLSNLRQLIRIGLSVYIIIRVKQETGPFTAGSVSIVYAKAEFEVILDRWKKKVLEFRGAGVVRPNK